MSNGNIFLLFKCGILIFFFFIQDVVTDEEDHSDLFYKVFGPKVTSLDDPLPWDSTDEDVILSTLENLPDCQNPNITNNIIVPALVMNVIPVQVLYVDCHNENQRYYVRKDPRPNSRLVFVLKESADPHPDYIIMSVHKVIEEQFHSAPSSPTTSPERAQPSAGSFIGSLPSRPSLPSLPSSTSASSRGSRISRTCVLQRGQNPSLDGIALLDDDSTLPAGVLAALQTKFYQRYAVEKWRWQLMATKPYKNYFNDLCLYLWRRQEAVGINATCGISTYMTDGGMFVTHLKQISKACYLLDTIYCGCISASKEKQFYIASAADKHYFILKERQVQGDLIHLTIENIVANVGDQYKVVFSTTGTMVIQSHGRNIITGNINHIP